MQPTLVGILLNHLGGQSMLVAGRKSALPAGDRVGMMLKHINPSLAARLSRFTLAKRRSLSGSLHVGASPARLSHDAAGRLRARPAGHATPTPAAGQIGATGPSYRAHPVDSCQISHKARAYSQQSDAFAPTAPQPDRQAPRLSWPWTQPASPSVVLEVVRQYVTPAMPALGELTDLFA